MNMIFEGSILLNFVTFGKSLSLKELRYLEIQKIYKNDSLGIVVGTHKYNLNSKRYSLRSEKFPPPSLKY